MDYHLPMRYRNLLYVLLFSLVPHTLLGAALPIVRSIDVVQPMTGLVLWGDDADDRQSKYGQSYALEFTYCPPCRMVVGKQDNQLQYDWTYIESVLNAAKQRGHQTILRFFYEYPGEAMGCSKTAGATSVPDYIKALPDYQETYKKLSEDGKCYYADWSNEELQWFTKQFLTDFAARYDCDPRIAFLEVGFGHWGEYHIYGNQLKLGKNFPSKTYQAEFLQHLDTIFQILPWSISIDAADNYYSPIADNQHLMNLHFGLFDDSFMHEEHDQSQGEGYNETCWKTLDNTRWQTDVCGGEISYYEDSDQPNFLNPAGLYGKTWEQASQQYHISFMICNDAIGGRYATPTRFKEGSMVCGYRFRLTSCRVQSDSTWLTFTNDGIAPLYKDAYPAIGTMRSATSLKGLLPGHERTCIIRTPLTNADDLQIVCDYILPTQSIQFNANITSATMEIPRTSLSPQKRLLGQQLVIYYNQHFFNLQGQQLY